MSSKKVFNGLGRGMDALLPSNFSNTELVQRGERIHNVLVADIIINSAQPRKHFDEKQLDELAQSITSYGILQPIIVKDVGAGKFEIVAGERRFRASVKAGLKEIPCLVRSPAELESLEIALTENVQRVDLNPLEQAAAIATLRDQFNIEPRVLAKRLGKAESTISNIVRLLDLPEEAKQALILGKITEGHARSVLALNSDPTKQSQLLDHIIQKGWTVRLAESFVQQAQLRTVKTPIRAAKKRIYKEVVDSWSQRFDTSVKIREVGQGGQIVIKYKSASELQRITKLIV